MISFRLVCVPPTTSHHHKRIVRVGKWTKLADRPELASAKAMLDSLLLPHQPPAPITGPVSLRLEFTWPWLASHSKKTRALGSIPHTSKPDVDNASKTLTDRLVALRFIEDDRKVVELHVRKWWGDAPGVAITIQPDVQDAPTAGGKIPRIDSDAGAATPLFADALQSPKGQQCAFLLRR